MLCDAAHPDADDHADPVGDRPAGSSTQTDSIAICAAATAYWMNGSIFLISRRSMQLLGREVADLAGDPGREVGARRSG